MTVTSADLVQNLVVGHKSDGRCVYDKAAKRQLAQRCLQPGVSLARTAMEHGVNANVLRKWVMQESSGALGRRKRGSDRASEGAVLVPVRTIAPTRDAAVHPTGYFELVVEGGTIRVYGRVDAEALSVALDCLARRA
jgi:transposase-like protein